MQLLLMRHGPAELGEPGKDELRSLTSDGKRQTLRAVRGLMTLLPKVNSIVSSPLIRARETAEIIASQYKGKVQIDESLSPGGEPTVVLPRRAGAVMIMVGHEPDLSELVGLLLGGVRKSVLVLKKAGCVLLEVERSDHARLVWALPPKVLRQLGK